DSPRSVSATRLNASLKSTKSRRSQNVRLARLRVTTLVFYLLFARNLARAQATPPVNPSASEAQAGTSTDLFVMFGSDFVRPGLAPKANYNIGLGHTFGFLKKNPIGDELTFG